MFRIALLTLLTLFTSCQKPKPVPKILHVASDFSYPPFVYKKVEENGQESKAGFEVELLEEIAQKINVKLEFEELQFKDIIDGVASERVDAAIGGITITPGRKKNVLFSTPFYESPLVTILSIDNTDTKIDESVDNKVYVVGDEEYGSYIKSLFEQRYPKVRVYDYMNFKPIADLYKVQNNTVFLTDKAYADFVLREHPNLKIVDSYVDYTGILTGNGHLPMAFAFNKKHDEIVKEVDKELANMEKDGRLKELEKKYGL